MQKIKDRFLLGIVTGIVASLPGRVMNKIEFELGLTDSRYEQMAASLFVNKKDSHSVQGKIIGKIANGLFQMLLELQRHIFYLLPAETMRP